MGLGFLAVDATIRWVLPLVLLLGLGGEVMAARRHRRWWVVGVGVLGAAVLYAGWFWSVRPVLYGGMALLLTASVLTFWSKRHPVVPLVRLRIRTKER